MKELKISKDLPLPPDIVTQKVAWLGTTGSGKTYGASKLAEEMWDLGAQFVVIDPVGVWYGLRLQEDGKNPSSIDIPIFGGLHGDVPLESTAGELLANLVVDKGLSCIIDVSQFESDAEKSRFATAFAEKLFFRKKSAPSAIHLFLEECQEFVPQNPQKGEERMLHSFIRMQKLGRNFGIGSSYITQRPQEVNKKALNMAQNLFVFRNTGTHERAAIEKWIEDKSLDESIAQDLPKLETGTCHIWSPEFLKVSKIIHISKKRTFNASATPEVGAIAKSRQLAPIDLEKVRKEMTATIEKAKSADPKELKRKIAELEREIEKTKKEQPKQNPVRIERIEVPSVGKRALEGLKESEKNMKKILVGMKSENEKTLNFISVIEKNLLKLSADISKIEQKTEIPKEKYIHVKPDIFKKMNFKVKVEAPYSDIKENKPLSKAAKAILSYLHSVNGETRTKTQLSVATGYSPGGGFNNNIYELTGLGYINSTSRGFSAIRGAYDLSLIDESFDSNIEKWKHKLGLAPRKIFEFLLSNDQGFTKEQLAENTGYQYGGGFNNNVYELSGLGLITKTHEGYKINPEILSI